MLLLRALLSVPLLASTALAGDPILQINGANVTKYEPAAATSIQDIRPINDGRQYGVQLDGSLRSFAPLGWAVNGNPYETAVGTTKIGDVALSTGTYAPTNIDLSLPATGFSLVFGRTYNGRQETSTPAHRDSDGIQGKNWQQVALPEIKFEANGAGDTDDMVYIVYGADRYLSFKRTATGESTFRGVNGAGGGIVYAANGTNEPETYTYYDPQGRVTTFLGFDADAGAATGQFWKMSNAAGDTAFVGSATLSSSTATTGYRHYQGSCREVEGQGPDLQQLL